MRVALTQGVCMFDRLRARWQKYREERHAYWKAYWGQTTWVRVTLDDGSLFHWACHRSSGPYERYTSYETAEFEASRLAKYGFRSGDTWYPAGRIRSVVILEDGDQVPPDVEEVE